jgi:hypothetical protein
MDRSDAAPRAGRIVVRRFASAAEADRHDLEYWLSIPASERLLQVWRLSVELWRWRGEFPDEPGFVDLLRTFVAHDVRFLIVGAYALALHGRPRATGDLDVWVDATPDNAPRVSRALAAFGAPMNEITEADFSRPGVVLQLGVAPGRIDILTDLTGLTFEEAWPGRLRHAFGDVQVDFIGREAFIRNKRATGRVRDLGDIEGME